ncbi:NADP(+)-dependent 2-alkenal reductase-like protein [Tanacetum coccineum]
MGGGAGVAAVTTVESKEWYLAAYAPQNVPTSEHIKLRTVNVSLDYDSIPDRHVLVQLLMFSVDPYLRNVITGRDGDLYLPQILLNKALAQNAKKIGQRSLCVKNKVNFLAIPETEDGEIDLITVFRRCWGNSTFDHLHSIFENAAYAPHDPDKRMLCVTDLAHLLSVERRGFDYGGTTMRREFKPIDRLLRKGTGTEVEAEERMEVLASLRNSDHIHSMELAQSQDQMIESLNLRRRHANIDIDDFRKTISEIKFNGSGHLAFIAERQMLDDPFNHNDILQLGGENSFVMDFYLANHVVFRYLSEVRSLQEKVLTEFGIARVVRSKNSNFNEGDIVVNAFLPIAEYSVIPSDFLRKIDPTANIALPNYINCFGKYL